MKKQIIDYYKFPTEKKLDKLLKLALEYAERQALYYIKRYGMNEEYMDDIAQESILSLMTYINHHNLYNKSILVDRHRALIRKIVERLVIDYLRREMRMRRVDCVATECYSSQTLVFEDAKIKVSELGKDYLDIYNLKCCGGLKNKEIASVISCSEGSVSRKLKKIKQVIKEVCVSW